MRWLDRLALALLLAVTAGGCARPVAEQVLRTSRGPWRRTGPIVYYTADNLYDHIDGEADFVVSFGFRSLAQGTYRRGPRPAGSSGADVETTVDLYDMGSASNAFALFRSRVDLGAQSLDVGTEGAGDEARVEFWQGRFYVDLSILSDEQGASVLAFARELASELPRTKAWPAYLKLLPTRGRVARSEQYLPTDLFGYEFLQRAVTARYKLRGSAVAKPGREAMLFACRYDSPADAAAALARFEGVLGRKKPARPLAIGKKGLVADDPVLGRLAVFQRGRFLGGMTGYAEDAATAALLADLDRHLRGP